MSDTLRTEVGSTVDGHADDGDEGGGDGPNSEKIWSEEGLLDGFVETCKARNLGIGYYYHRTSLSSPCRSTWEGKNGTINHICDGFKVLKRKRRIVKRILNDILTQEYIKKPYDGRDMRRRNQVRSSVIEPGSVDEGLLVDWMEDNDGFRQTTIFLNQHRTKEGRMHVGRSAVMNALDRMNSKINLVTTQVQGGSSDAWAEARKNRQNNC